MRLKHFFMMFAVLTVAMTVLACSGSDDGDSGGDDPTPAAEPQGNGDDSTGTEEPNEDGGNDGGGGFGGGTGTLTIGDETYEFTGIGCVFSAEDSGQPDFPFNLSGFGESSTGARAQLSADIYDPSGQERTEGDGVSHGVDFIDIEDFANPSVSWESYHSSTGDGTAMTITIDGKTIHAEGTFDDGRTEEFETVPGTLDVECP